MNFRSDYYQTLTHHAADVFAGALLKIKRAESHLLEAEAVIGDYLNRRSQTFLIAPYFDREQVEIVFVPRLLPLEFSGSIGDAVHNLRAALDHLAVATVGLTGGDSKEVHFPTGTDRKRFEARVKEEITDHRASPDATKLFTKLEAYYGGDNALHALHDLDIRDKHKLLTPTLSILQIKGLDVLLGEKTVFLNGTDSKRQRNGQFSATIDCFGIRRGDYINLKQNFRAAHLLAFGDVKFFKGKPIVPTLSDLTKKIEGIIRAFGTHFLGQRRAE